MSTDPKQLQKGTQVAYVPSHARNNIAHPDVEFGFVVSVRENGAFCRYFYRNGELRTRANSELTPFDLLYRYRSRDQSVIDKIIEDLKL